MTNPNDQSTNPPANNDGCLYCGLKGGYHRPNCPYYGGGSKHEHHGDAK